MGVFDGCIDCPAREVGCHSTCEVYLQAKEKHDKAMASKRTKNEFNTYMGSVSAGFKERDAKNKKNKFIRRGK